MSSDPYLTAQEAADALGITLATLYAYVSRGQVRSEPVPDDSRKRRYLRADVERLQLKKKATRQLEDVAEDALNFGVPMLRSSITLIDKGQLYYRGYAATELADQSPFEVVVSLLWRDDFDPIDLTSLRDPAVSLALDDLPALSRISSVHAALMTAAADEPSAYDLRPEAVLRSGTRILSLMVEVVSGFPIRNGTVGGHLAGAWTNGSAAAAALLNAALILCADHELNASSFAARVAASTRATPYAAVAAGMGAFQGTKHGGYTERVNAFLREVEYSGSAATVIAERLGRGEEVPGFGHRLYPEGDPRATYLLSRLRENFPDSDVLDMDAAICEAADATLALQPNLDYALGMVTRVLGIDPANAPLIFATGRVAGWIAQAAEQYEADVLIRPRATYVGRPPTQLP
jgi:citrate synthase